eukprot:jgi/Hompol1/5657/HPOL_004610-RA
MISFSAIIVSMELEKDSLGAPSAPPRMAAKLSLRTMRAELIRNNDAVHVASCTAIDLETEVGAVDNSDALLATLNVKMASPYVTLLMDLIKFASLISATVSRAKSMPTAPQVPHYRPSALNIVASLMSAFQITQITLKLSINLIDIVAGVHIPKVDSVRTVKSNDTDQSLLLAAGIKTAAFEAEIDASWPAKTTDSLKTGIEQLPNISTKSSRLIIEQLQVLATPVYVRDLGDRSSWKACDTLFDCDQVSVDISMLLTDRTAKLHLALNVTSVVLDLSHLSAGSSIDYFAAAVIVRSLIDDRAVLQNQPRHKSRSFPPALDHVDILFSSNLAIRSIRAILVGDIGNSGVFAKMESIGVITSIYRNANGSDFDLSSSIATVDSALVASFSEFQGVDKIESRTDLLHPILVIKNISATPSSSDQLLPIQAQANPVKIDFILDDAAIGIRSLVGIVKIAAIFTPHGRELRVAPSDVASLATFLKLSIQQANVSIELPSHVQLRGAIDDVLVSLQDGGILGVTAKLLVAEAFVTNRNSFQTIASATDIDVSFSPSFRDVGQKFYVGVAMANLVAPYGFEMSDIVENGINLYRGLKALAMNSFGRPFGNSSASNTTTVSAETIPEIKVRVDVCHVHFQDDPSEEVMAKARILLHEYNSKKFIEAMHAAKKKDQEQHMADFDQLLWAVLNNVSVVLSVPTLLSDTIEETLHIIDPSTPPDTVYDDLFARDLTIELQSVDIRLRECPHSLLQVPESSPKLRTWRTTGLLVVAEPLLPSETRRTIMMPFKNVVSNPIVISRTVNLPKIYLQTSTSITCASVIRACYGSSLEPCLADVSAVIESFTKPNVDPSPLIGWWDKMRLMLHGQNSLKISGGGELRLHILGSNSPSYDPDKTIGMDGVDLSFAGGVSFVIGAPDSDNIVTLEAGEVRMSLPHGQTTGYEYASRLDDLVAKLKGGIRITIGVQFMTFQPSDDLINQPIEVPPWKAHSEIMLRSPEFCQTPNFGKIWDSFFGFRSSSMHVTINVTSPMPFFSGLVVPNNYLSLSSSSLNQLQILAMIYQSVLTSMPVRTRAAFYRSTVANTALGHKPKLSRMIGTVRIVTSLQPLVLSFISEFEDLSGGVGLRARATHMESDVFLRQHRLRQLAERDSTISRRPVYRWALEKSQISFVSIECCALSFKSLQTQPQDTSSVRSAGPTNTAANEFDDDSMSNPGYRDEWIFVEDVYYTSDFSLIKLTPFAWSPRIIYFRRGTNDENREHEKEIHREQLSLLKTRQREIEAIIWNLKEEQKDLESRMAVFFDTSLQKESAALIDQLTHLYEKRALIQDNIKELTETLAFVRNVVFKLVDLQTKNFALKYCMSNAAAKVVSELVQLVGNQHRESSQPASESTSDFRSSERASTGSVDPEPAARSHSFKSSPTSASPNVAEMLDQLLHDLQLGIHVHIPNETDAEFDYDVQYSTPLHADPEISTRSRK